MFYWKTSFINYGCLDNGIRNVSTGPNCTDYMPNIRLFTMNVKIPILFSPVACKITIKGTHAIGVGPYRATS